MEGVDPVVVRFKRVPSMKSLLTSAHISICDSYVNGDMVIEEGTLRDFLFIVGKSAMLNDEGWLPDLNRSIHSLIASWQHYNPAHRSKANVAHHYDLSGELYDQFLDEHRQYSCAYFEGNETLEQAQEKKMHHIARKLLIKPGMRILDIGSGWGGLGLFLAKNYGAEVYGVTLSEEQHAWANDWADKEGLADKAKFHLQDYRAVDGKFDRIVSVGMFEHVGQFHFDEYFQKVRSLLADDGVGLIHTIGHMGPPEPISPWIRKYIFPGAYLPSLSQIGRAVERSRLWLADFENLRLHYAKTLAMWNERFQQNRDKVKDLYDEKFCRMWELYLVSCEMAFVCQAACVFQLQVSNKIDAVPITRRYLYSDT
ncbi:class I SAM-dependent methyltransferase [Hwanghaeella grinnelliae]|uniref:Class I SAM-dependent methyltransferase n=2 Tax=Hwanghaeella grinnelliae TaxID=2500179 RepID=A0A3S2VSU1_9PROT|nr:class I SAM-dependent methyltransferase [Hwanghaeella grinnelliae]